VPQPKEAARPAAKVAPVAVDIPHEGPAEEEDVGPDLVEPDNVTISADAAPKEPKPGKPKSVAKEEPEEEEEAEATEETAAEEAPDEEPKADEPKAKEPKAKKAKDEPAEEAETPLSIRSRMNEPVFMYHAPSPRRRDGSCAGHVYFSVPSACCSCTPLRMIGSCCTTSAVSPSGASFDMKSTKSISPAPSLSPCHSGA